MTRRSCGWLPARPWRSSIVLLALLAAAAPDLLGAETIVCLGDSLTAGYGVDEDQAYPAVVQDLAQADHRAWTVINAGISGDTTAGGLRRLNWVLKAKPDVVLVALGGNDGLRGLPVAQTRANLTSLVQRITAAGARPLLAGMQLPLNYGEDFRTQFSQIFPAVSAATHTPLLPFLLEGVGGDRTLNQADGVHPTAEGQRRVAAVVYRFLVLQLEPAPASAPAPAAGAGAQPAHPGTLPHASPGQAPAATPPTAGGAGR